MKLGLGYVQKRKSSVAIFISLLLLLAVSFGCIFTPSAQAEEFTKPEQIILTWTADPTSSQAITWLTSNNSPAQVQYIMADEFSGNFDSAPAVDANGTTFGSVYYRYTVNLNGLDPNTKYMYQVGQEGAWSDTLSFTTAADKDNFSFLYMGDVQSDYYADWGNMVDSVYQDYPEIKFSLLGGDLANNSADENEWGQFLDAAAGVFSRIPVMPTKGNHDGVMYSEFFALPDNGPAGLTQGFYSFDYGNAHFVVLDSSNNTNEAAKQWLREDLQNTDKAWKFAVFHHPAYPAFDDHKAIDDSIRDNWIPILEQNHVDMVFVGHQHQYMRTHPIYQGEVQTDSAESGIVYVMGNAGSKTYAGGGGFPYIAREETGSNYQVIDINGDVLTLTAKKADGDLIETYTINKTPVQPEEPITDVLYDGTVTLTPGETFDVTAYDSKSVYTVKKTTPLGALQAAATAGSFTYDVTDKNHSTSGALLLDNVGDYKYAKKGSQWFAYVNDEYKDGYNNAAGGLNLIELADGDKVEFYYAGGVDKNDLTAVKAVATAVVKTVVSMGVAPTDWTLQLSGAKSASISKSYFEQGLACASSGHQVSWTDGDGNIWGGVPLWLLVGMVDDNPDIGTKHINFNDDLATKNYQVKVIAGDGATATFASAAIAHNNDYVVANTLNGKPLSLRTESGKVCWPLQLKGSAVSGKQQVGNIVKIELSGLPEPPIQPIPEVRIVKYGEDHTTIIQEKTVDYLWMEKESGFDVIGDGTTIYKYEGITNNPDDVWDANEAYPGGYKIANAVKGTRIKDLCELVGGMGAGTDVVLVAKDGFETRLPYSSIYTDPSVQARQGDAILAWWADGKYVPDYSDGMRVFFTPDGDNVYGQWDMHETLPENYWHYYYGDGVQYPSCAGLSAKYITEIRVYSIPQGDWTLELDGQDIGGLHYDVSKTYFESALACQFGANHKVSYKDSKNRVWEGMPLWFLVGFVDDADQHSNDAFNDTLASTGYQVVITAEDGASVTIDSADIIRNNNYIVANSLDGALIPESDGSWPLRLVGPNVGGKTSISQIVSIKLLGSDKPQYNVVPVTEAIYTIGATKDGIKTMTVNDGQTGFKYFTVSVEPVKANEGTETLVFTHLRDNVQLGLNAAVADFDIVNTAKAGFNVKAGDIIKVYIVDQLTNDTNRNPIVFQ